MNEFEKMFDVYQEIIRKEIEKDGEMEGKLPKIQSLIFVLHGVCNNRFSKDYKAKSAGFISKIEGQSLGNIKYTPDQKFSYWGILMDWFALMIEERYAIVSNLNRVDFGR